MKKIFFAILLYCNLFAQIEEFSIHKQHREEFPVDEKISQLYPIDGAGIIPLQYDKSRLTGATIFGYLPDWEYQSATLRYDILTHIAAFDFAVSATGSMTNPAGWPWTNIINTAHQNGVKVILTAVNFDKDQIRTILTNATVKQTFFNTVKSRMQQYQLDGVNIDFESLYSADRGTLLNNFMNELTAFIHASNPSWEVSFAGPAVNWGGWDIAGLANSCDYIFIMGYSFYGSWSTTTGPCAPYTGGSYNIYNTITSQYQTAINNNPQKIILGVPYYGLKWQAQTNQPGSTVIDYISSTRFKNDAVSVQQYGLLWSSTHQVPWYRYQSNNEWYQVWYDNDSSLGIKYALAQSKNIRGVGMWALGYDGNRPELWNELYKRFYQTVPVELVALNYETLPAGVMLKWETASEKNNRGFQIERKNINADENYSHIGFVDGYGTSAEKHNYLFIDKNLEFGNYSYRLSQIDFDGTKKNLGEIEVSFNEMPDEFVLYQNYPNPFNPSTKIKFAIPTSPPAPLLEERGESQWQFVSLKVYDALGNEVATLVNEEKAPGVYEVEFPSVETGHTSTSLSNHAPFLQSGIYFYQLRVGENMISKKMTLIK